MAAYVTVGLKSKLKRGRGAERVSAEYSIASTVVRYKPVRIHHIREFTRWDQSPVKNNRGKGRFLFPELPSIMARKAWSR